jgi:hypothetical protein
MVMFVLLSFGHECLPSLSCSEGVNDDRFDQHLQACVVWKMSMVSLNLLYGFKWLSRALDLITKPQYILTVVDEGISGKFSST